MDMHRDMVVWAPTAADMNEIRRRVSKERAKVASELFEVVRSIFRNNAEPAETPPRAESRCGAAA